VRQLVRLTAAALAVLAGTLAVPAGAVTAPHAGAAPAGRLVQGHREIMWPVGHDAPHAAGPANSGTQQLAYGGGFKGHGVQKHPAVYLVFWGSQWNKSDPYADYLQRFFRGLYGRGDDWTALQHEYCDGVKTGAVSCPAKKPRVGGPLGGGVLKGVWFDDSTLAVPTDVIVAGTAIDSVAAEAARAAAHFGNTSAKQNVNAQYVISEPSHFDSLGYGYYCAYHSSVGSSYGELPYTDLPYVTDLGFDCGQNAVNGGSAGTFDGLSIIAGHEFIETLTDPFPASGWVDGNGEENADKCAWQTTGPGAMADLHLSTGTFAVQGSWSNRANNGNGGCLLHSSG
jgi:serine protease